MPKALHEEPGREIINRLSRPDVGDVAGTDGADARGRAMMLAMTGETWVVKGVPGTADYTQFYTAAAEKGWIFTHPSAAKAQPGQAHALAEMYREIAAAVASRTR